MRSFLAAGALNAGTIVLTLSLGAPAVDASSQLVALSHLALNLGYTYTRLSAQSAVALSRPGVYILIRSGNSLVDVNNTIESTVQVPVLRANDMYVGSAFVVRLRALAHAYVPHKEVGTVTGPLAAGESARGVLTVTVAPTGVSDAVVVSGSGPPNVPLTLTLFADITREIPRVLLSRRTTQTNAAGKFSVAMSISPLELQTSVILVSATSLPGVTEAHASYVLGQPSPSIVHPVDELPADFRPH